MMPKTVFFITLPLPAKKRTLRIGYADTERRLTSQFTVI
jgi:hypothetical protein